MDQQTTTTKTKTTTIESLEISLSSDGDYVKCQNCHSLQPVMKDDSRLIAPANSARIYKLQKMITYTEKYHKGSKKYSCKKEKEELKDLLEEQKKKDILRRISLYSSKITGYKFYCGACFDRALEAERKK